MNFTEKIIQCARSNRSWLCVGLDPDYEKMPDHIEKSIAGIETFLKSIIDSTNDLVCAYKPNSAFFEQFGADGLVLLKQMVDYIPDNIPVILDAKRGDIGNTSRMYAKSAFEHLGVDAITVNPYMGYDCVKPFLDYQEKGVIILCLTSNPSSADFQKAEIVDTEFPPIPLYIKVAQKALSWNEHGNAAIVVGATKPDELAELRSLVGEDMPILVPGVGAQGGDLEASLKAGGNKKHELAIINVSRSVLYASKDKDYTEKSRLAAYDLVARIRRIGF